MSDQNFERFYKLLALQNRRIKKINKLIEDFDFTNSEILKILGVIHAAAAHNGANDSSLEASIRKAHFEEEVRRKYASKGAEHLQLVELPDGRFAAAMDDVTVHLPRRVAALLEVLARNDGDSPDGLVRWKSREFVRQELAVVPGQPISKRNLNQLVLRLRQIIHPPLHRNFVPKDRRRGLRFQLRRPEAPPDGTSG